MEKHLSNDFYQYFLKYNFWCWELHFWIMIHFCTTIKQQTHIVPLPKRRRKSQKTQYIIFCRVLNINQETQTKDTTMKLFVCFVCSVCWSKCRLRTKIEIINQIFPSSIVNELTLIFRKLPQHTRKNLVTLIKNSFYIILNNLPSEFEAINFLNTAPIGCDSATTTIRYVTAAQKIQSRSLTSLDSSIHSRCFHRH